jgi:hypothetical protein
VKKVTCTAVDRDSRELKSFKDLIDILFKAPLCSAKADWQTPFGPRCEKHTRELEASLKSGNTLFHALREGLHPELEKVSELPKTRIQ